jgi:hypothetical protein
VMYTDAPAPAVPLASEVLHLDDARGSLPLSGSNHVLFRALQGQHCARRTVTARLRSLLYAMSNGIDCSAVPTNLACSIPTAFKGVSNCPWMMPLRFSFVSPWRTTRARTTISCSGLWPEDEFLDVDAYFSIISVLVQHTSR